MEHVHNKMAKMAFAYVSQVKDKKEFRSLARSFPSMIQVNGFGAGIAFLYSKKQQDKQQSNPYEAMYELIHQWTSDKFCQGEKCKPLIERIVDLDTDSYRLYSVEVMNLCLWVKRFAEGMSESGAEGEQQYGE